MKKNLQRIYSASDNLFWMLHAVGDIYERSWKQAETKSLKSHWTAWDDVLHCIPWGEAASTDIELVPDESGVRFSQFGKISPVSTLSTKRVLTCPYMSDLKKGQSEMLQGCTITKPRASASVSADSCNPMSADLSS